MKNLPKKFYIIFSDMGRLPPKLYKTQKIVLKRQQQNPQYKAKEFQSQFIAYNQLEIFKLEHQRFVLSQKKKQLQENLKEKMKQLSQENTKGTMQNTTNIKTIITDIHTSNNQKFQTNLEPSSPKKPKIKSLQQLTKEKQQLYGLTPQIQKLLYYHTPTQSSCPINPEGLYAGYFDGCTKFNPGPSGAGYFIRQQKKSILEASCPLGTKTNNQSQFLALLYLLTDAYINGIRYLNVYGDSKLAIEITNRKMTASNINIIHYAQAVFKLKNLFKFIKLEHVHRQYNTKADKLSNQGVKKKLQQGKDKRIR